jgi:hypothetical protein
MIVEMIFSKALESAISALAGAGIEGFIDKFKNMLRVTD